MASHPEVSLSLSQVEAELGDRLWHGDTIATPSVPVVSSGFAALDRELPGCGWPTHTLTELLLPAAGIGEIRLLAKALKALSDSGRQIILIAPPYCPHLAGWTNLGIDPRRLLLIETSRSRDILWATEQSIKSGAYGALIAWLPDRSDRPFAKTLNEAMPYLCTGIRPEALRRLQMNAAGADGLTFLFRSSSARLEPSAAPLRVLLEADRDKHFAVRILKRRGPVLAKRIPIPLGESGPLVSSKPGTATGMPACAFPGLELLSETVLPISFPLSDALGRPSLSKLAARPHPAPAA